MVNKDVYIARTRNVSECLYSLYARLCSLDGVRPRVICWAWLRHRAHAYFMRRRWRICRYQSVTGGLTGRTVHGRSSGRYWPAAGDVPPDQSDLWRLAHESFIEFTPPRRQSAVRGAMKCDTAHWNWLQNRQEYITLKLTSGKVRQSQKRTIGCNELMCLFPCVHVFLFN